MATIDPATYTRNAIQGLDHIKRELAKLDQDIANKINRAAAGSGATALKNKAAKILGPKHKRKVGTQRSRRKSRRNQEVYNIGPRADHWQLAFLEYGAAPHEIRPRRAKSLVIFGGKTGARVAVLPKGRGVKHRGIRATFFLTRALYEGQDEAYRAIRKRYLARLKKVKSK